MRSMSENDDFYPKGSKSGSGGRAAGTKAEIWHSPGMRLWLFFAQLVTVLLSLWWVLSIYQPLWLERVEVEIWGEERLTSYAQLETEEGTDALDGELYAAAFSGRTEGKRLPIWGRPGVTSGAPDFRAAARVAAKAVVSINVSKAVDNPYRDDPWFRFFYGDIVPEEQTAVGSGVIVDARGYVLTNHHVIEGADAIEVQLNDRRVMPAQLVGTDPGSDIAVLRLPVKGGELLPAMKWGNASEAQVGDWVLAIGNPFGVGQTVTSGIVSGLGRSSLGLTTFENFIQTDAAINPGNSGGALVDVRGRLLGINTAIFSRSGANVGIGFAIPESLVRQVMADIISHGYVRRGWIGVESRNVNKQLAQVFDLPPSAAQRQVVVVSVLRNGPAHRAGVKPGDVILAVERKPVARVAELLNLIAGLEPGKEAGLTVVRGGRQLQVSLVPVLRPAAAGRGSQAAGSGR